MVMQHRDEVLKLIPTLVSKDPNGFNSFKEVHNVTSLVTNMVVLEGMVRVIPHPMHYPSPKAPDYQKPKMLQVAPQNWQIGTADGFYMWPKKEAGWKTYLWLGAFVFLAFFFLLFRVWPEWLRLGVWYVSWYLLVFLVSSSPIPLIYFRLELPSSEQLSGF